MFGWDDAIGLAIGGIISGLGAGRANKQMETNSLESMNWQKMMSDTSHLREVQDLQNAGLNPILSANKGAPMGSVSMPNLENENAAAAQAIQQAIQVKAEMGLKERAQSNADAQTEAQVKLAKAQENSARASAAVQTEAQRSAAMQNQILQRQMPGALKHADYDNQYADIDAALKRAKQAAQSIPSVKIKTGD